MDVYALAIEELVLSDAVTVSCKSDRTAVRYRNEINRRLQTAGAAFRVGLDDDKRTLCVQPNEGGKPDAKP